MPYVPPTSKWKTNRWQPADCGNSSAGGVGVDQCVLRVRFDALATPRVTTIAGFEAVCADHEDTVDPPVVGEIELFTGEWMTFDEWHAYESAFYSWVVWHEIDGRTELPEATRAEMRGKQKERSTRVSAGIPNLDRAETDDGPWKPLAAITNPSAAARAAVGRVAGWAMADSNLRGEVFRESETRTASFDETLVAWWWEGQGGSRVLHVDSGNQLTPQQRNQIAAIVELVYGPGRLAWEG